MAPLKGFAYRLLSVPYEIIFKEKIGSEAQEFLVSTTYVAVGTLIGALLTFIFGVIGARALGPVNFGSFGIITTLSAILAVCMGLSLTPTIRYASGTQDDLVRDKIISTSFIQVVSLTGAFTIIYFFFTAQLCRLFGVSSSLLHFSIAYATIFTFFAFTMNSLRILHKMKVYALLSAVQSVVLLAVFLTFVSNNVRSWQVAVFAAYVSYAVVSLILVLYLRNFIRLQFDRFWAKKIVRYALFNAPGAVAASFMGVDRLFINTYMTTADVGIYNAYVLPSITVAAMFAGIFNATFFPYASGSRDRQTIFGKINKTVPFLVVSLVPFIVFIEVATFIFYGNHYPFSWEIASFFAIGAAALIFYEVYTWLMASVGARGAKVTTISSVLALVVLVVLNVVLIPRIGISGAALTLIFAYLIPTIFLFTKRRLLTES